MYNFDSIELQKTNSAYEEKLSCGGKVTEKSMLSLLWDLEELKRVNEEGRKLKTEVLIALDVLQMPPVLQRQRNLARKLAFIRSQMQNFVKGLYHFKRTPASHMFVFIISSALRDKKPYALPIQCLPYAGIKEHNMRSMVNAIVKEMVHAGMKVAGIYMYILNFIHVHVHVHYAY